jgi:hypothetical protein
MENKSRYSLDFEAVQLYRLSMSAEYMAQAILFPFIVLAGENFKGLNKRFFGIPENKSDDLLADILENYEKVCLEFGQEETAAGLIGQAMSYRPPESKFLTASAPLRLTLDKLREEFLAGRNVAISGEPGVGKRLRAQALHSHPDNPRRTKPFLSFHCDTKERGPRRRAVGAKEVISEEGRARRAGDSRRRSHYAERHKCHAMQLQERLAEIIVRMGGAGPETPESRRMRFS